MPHQLDTLKATDPHMEELLSFCIQGELFGIPISYIQNVLELFSLIIDKVGDVLCLERPAFENKPTTLDETWRTISSGIYCLEDDPLIVLDTAKLLRLDDTLT